MDENENKDVAGEEQEVPATDTTVEEATEGEEAPEVAVETDEAAA